MIHEPDEIELGGIIGSGAFGDVRIAEVRGRKVAAKMVNPSGAKEVALARELLHKEARAMDELPHENIVRLLGVCVDPGKMCILMEFMHQGSLRHVMDTGPKLSNDRVFTILREIVSAMKFAHAHTPHPILHRDLKSQNILVDQHGRVAVGDFGLSTGAGTLSKTSTGGGTCMYDAPEVLDEDTWVTAGDVYSFGVLAWEIATGKSPWEGSTLKQIHKAVVLKEKRPHGKQWDEPMDDSHHPFFATLIKDCWAQEPVARPSFADIFVRFEDAATQLQFRSVATPSAAPRAPGLQTMVKELLKNQQVVVEKLDENQALLQQQGAEVTAMASSFTNLEGSMVVLERLNRAGVRLLEELVSDATDRSNG
jgi:serine/threonine protein kinase